MYKTNFTDNGTEVNPHISEDLLSQLTQASEVQPENAGLFRQRLTIEDFKHPPAPREWIVDKLFAAGSLSIVVGEAGSKKTWAMMDAAVCVALGKCWLDFETKQSPVLLVDEESGSERLQERMYKTLRGHLADKDNPPITALPSNSANFGDPDWINALSLEIQQTDARLVIIDALADVMPGRDENSVKDILPVFLSLRRVAESTGAAIVLIHHANKQGGYRGSTAIKGAVDLMLLVESKPGSPNIDFKTEKARDSEPVQFAAVANFNALEQFWLTASDPITNKQEFGEPDRYVLRYLSEHGESLMDDITSRADTCSPASARRAVYRLATLQCVERTDGGGRGRNVQATYTLTQKGKDTVTKL